MRQSSEDVEGPDLAEKEIQTDSWTAENAVNTEQDWESKMSFLETSSAQLGQQYEALCKMQEQEEDENQIKHLELKREDAIRQQKALIDKMESLQVKLKLNCYKTTRKNFTVKKMELIGERDRLREENSRLRKELEEVERSLRLLMEEQCEEKKIVQRELEDLRRTMDRVAKEYEEERKIALRDEEASVNLQREVLTSQVKEWLADAEGLLNALRSDLSHGNMQQISDWENNVEAARTGLDDMQLQFNQYQYLIQQGQQLDSLPPVTLPPLPPIPTVELMSGLSTPHHLMAPHVPSHIRSDPPQRHPPPVAYPSDYTRSSSQLGTSAHQPVPSSSHTTSFKPHPLSKTLPTKHVHTAQPTPTATPTDTAQPVAMLDKILEKLATQFPHCNRGQLMMVLKEIKTSRGTMAGLSIEELTQQVAKRLTQMERPGHAAVFQIRPAQTVSPAGLRLCMMCQHHVEAGTQHIMNCSHVVHKKCISVWLQSNKNNVCPFCPSK